MTEETLGYILWGLIAVLVILPPRWDPAIRLAEWNTKKKQRRRD